MTDTRPLWLLDFDGVVNVLAPRGDEKVWQDWNVRGTGSSHESIPWYLWSTSVASLVRKMSDSGVRVVWLTSWEHAMLGISRVIPELPEGLEILTRADDVTRRSSWKAGAARSIVTSDVPVLWTDDDLHKILRPKADVEWAQTITLTRIRPNRKTGVTPAQAEQIRAWARESLKP